MSKNTPVVEDHYYTVEESDLPLTLVTETGAFITIAHDPDDENAYIVMADDCLQRSMVMVDDSYSGHFLGDRAVPENKVATRIEHLGKFQVIGHVSDRPIYLRPAGDDEIVDRLYDCLSDEAWLITGKKSVVKALLARTIDMGVLNVEDVLNVINCK